MSWRLAGSAVAIVLEERDGYIREGLGSSAVALVLEERSRYIREWLGSSPAQQWP